MADSSELLIRARDAAKQKRNGLAVMLLRQLTQENPPLGERWGAAAQLAASLQDMWTAAEAQKRMVETGRRDTASRLSLARFLHESGQFEPARAEIEALYEDDPGNVRVVYASAYINARLQNDELAIERYREAALMDPRQSVAWAVMMRMKKATEGDPDIDHMRRAEAQLTEEKAPLRAPVKYGLGYAMEHLGDYDSAFSLISEGSHLMHEHHQYNRTRMASVLQGLKNACPPEMIANAEGHDTDRPIFVVGAPRAGTTLVETILNAHSGVVGGAELPFMTVASYPAQNAASESPGNTDAALKRMLGADAWKKIGATYATLGAERFGPTGKFVDSTTTTPWQMGFILSAMPNARIIWMTRNRADALWAIYKVLFAVSQTFSYDFANIQDRLNWVANLRDHFAEIAPQGQILRVNYEDLARNPDEWIPKILSHCNLEYEDSVRDFHKSDRIVSTASFAQVRQPISTKSIGSWRRYEQHLAPIYREVIGPDYESES